MHAMQIACTGVVKTVDLFLGAMSAERVRIQRREGFSGARRCQFSRNKADLLGMSKASKNMLFAVLFKDKAGHGEVRAANLQAHIDWLEEHKALVPVGGSLRHELGETPIGGLWIAEADSKREIEELIRTDPFYIAGLRERCDILHWSKANAQRKVSI